MLTHATHSCTGAVDAFRRLFGDPLDFWIHSRGIWHHPVEPDHAVSEAAAIIAPETLPVLPSSLREPLIDEIASGVFRIGAPLALVGGPDVLEEVAATAWGTFHLQPAALARTMLRLAHQNAHLRNEAADLRASLVPHLEQISYDFEELTYLRRLGEQTDLRDVSNPLGDLADRVLHDLRTIVRASSLIFLAAERKESAEAPGQIAVGAPVVWKGSRPLGDGQARDLVNMLRDPKCLERPAVCNHMPRDLRFAAFPDVNSCILVPAIHRGTCYGWLLALNRQTSADLDDESSDTPVSLTDQEFGTVQAGLMNSAAGTLAAHYRNSELFREKEQLLTGIVRALINAIDAKDSYTCGHSDRVAGMAKRIGHQLGLANDECERIYMSGLLHDIGKIGIPDSVLLKPGKLTEEEFAIIQQHPTIGYTILKHLPQLRGVLPGVLHHHEAVNGGGYPDGLVGDEIPLVARILAVADSYDAMTSARPYRSAMPEERAESILRNGAADQWDARVVDAFFEALPAIRQAGIRSAEGGPLKTKQTPISADVPCSDSADTIAQAVSGFVKDSPGKPPNDAP